MQAIILAAGMGKRLMELTQSLALRSTEDNDKLLAA